MYNIDTLSGLTGLSRRTIRYYIQRELLPPPEGEGRGAFYTEEHLKRLEMIKKWSDQGVPIIHMKAMLEGRALQPEVEFKEIGVTTWERCRLREGIELMFSPGSLSYMELQAVKEFIERLKGDKDEE